MDNRTIATAIIVAAGKGRRMGSQISKQFLKLRGKEILAHTVSRFEQFSNIQEIVLVTGKDNIEDVNAMVKDYGWKKISAVVIGGKERQDSVKCGLNVLSEKTEIVLIHDGVRPFVTEDMIDRSIEAAQNYGACVLGVAAKDTIKICDEDGVVVETPKRSALWHIQTPQTFRTEIIESAYKKATQEGFIGTDDASVAEFAGAKIKVIPGSYQNIKITTREDILVGTCFLEEEEE
ncbi:2-C-methyl-D-erythritol 4-phosphate cytidylyltransferase [Anaerotignum sp. MB30-C6]|uniref:2-C-methyl-D-erythritol 4-phosphate cytidylyltransferase n=1 Tax=Anaerotignum sp. MB30-C6 TaxID=3070814 RepID=UPI0027DE83A0|nr:2-C-methyl-D-erythritol 4-phosphate cytidylyltransferase [Anaerotignum sp. MB30-C6]WMI80231.1 2-C-methyl-D-erythritol 4-phosphate cytidylyltransferase [Anaerotignum sp. MB30-C6]